MNKKMPGFFFNSDDCVIVVVDDDEGNIFTFENNYRDTYNLQTFCSPKEALEFIQSETVDIVITDQRMPVLSGIELIREIKKINSDIICMLFSAFTDIDLLKDCINSNLVYRFLEKPFDFDRLNFEIRQAIDKRRLLLENKHFKKLLQLENEYLKREINEKYPSIIGSDGDLKKIIEKAAKVASYDSSILITGETGTGKELIARHIHEHSPRKDRPMISLVCSAFGSGVLESELFGHEKGAFTGASQRRIGRFEAADGGTLFLDEIGDISPEIQKKLLRVLQEGEFERVGGNTTITVDVRLLSATNRDLVAMIEEGSFREDLYYRLNVVPIHLPPLRKRKKDLPLLIEYFFQFFNKRFSQSLKGISQEARSLLSAYHWPGNIRELSNVFERAVITAGGDFLEVEDLAISVSVGRQFGDNREISKSEILRLLEVHNGNKTHVAKALGISRQYLHRKIRDYKI